MLASKSKKHGLCWSIGGRIPCADGAGGRFWIWYTAPIHTSLTLNRADGSVHEVSLIEDMLDEDSTTSYPNRIPAYHAMSASGNVTAEYVYVGYVLSLMPPDCAGLTTARLAEASRPTSRSSRTRELSWKARLPCPCTAASTVVPRSRMRRYVVCFSRVSCLEEEAVLGFSSSRTKFG
jgi:hypothetical protein